MLSIKSYIESDRLMNSVGLASNVWQQECIPPNSIHKKHEIPAETESLKIVQNFKKARVR